MFITKYQRELSVITVTVTIVCCLLLYNRYKIHEFRDATLIIVDNKQIAYVEDSQDANQILMAVMQQYSVKSGFQKIEYMKIKNKVSYEIQRVKADFISSKSEVLAKLKSKNNVTGQPVITVEMKGQIREEEKLAPPVRMVWSSDLQKGQTKLVEGGEEGKKTILKEVVVENGKQISEKIISESITQKPREKVVMNGSKTIASNESLALLMPSRGNFTSYFGARWGRKHEGVDIGAPAGTPIYAAMEGTISYASWMQGYGKMIKMNHGNGLETIYGHCSEIEVKEGQKVEKGQEIGKVGSTGNSTGPHLHFEVRINGIPQNPIQYLNK